ncbi:hypothetical protein [Streptomyces sp. ML-6]|uniref:hypothetical protein n=1 Tax=Streptomyces sp. ML-6 TaxID=2982693 RepID=UPI0024BFF6B0|nr:hypothetical protein [Streptomyces sp. ML-6]MDK0519983.1 hypothetical protein [Streptomyces sp. ML-6]
MSETAVTTAHEAYAFACMRCGYGWEQAYEIEHHLDGSNNDFVIYKADGERVPSPLSRPTCMNCGGHVVRIMRAGRVSTVQQLLHNPQPSRSAAPPAPATTSGQNEADTEAKADADARQASAATAAPSDPGRHRHLSDLLHPFHHRK